MSVRHVNLGDLAEAVAARIRLYCPSVRDVRVCQATSNDELVRVAEWELQLPAAVVAMGPIEQPGDGRVALAVRTINLGVILLAEWSPQQLDSAGTIWAVEDELNRAMLPALERAENLGVPVAVCGDQTGASRGVLLFPAGSLPVGRTPRERAARVYQIMALDWPRERDA